MGSHSVQSVVSFFDQQNLKDLATGNPFESKAQFTNPFFKLGLSKNAPHGIGKKNERLNTTNSFLSENSGLLSTA